MVNDNNLLIFREHLVGFGFLRHKKKTKQKPYCLFLKELGQPKAGWPEKTHVLRSLLVLLLVLLVLVVLLLVLFYLRQDTTHQIYNFISFSFLPIHFIIIFLPI